MNTSFQNNLDFAKEMDQNDPLKSFRDKFHIPVQKNGDPFIYLCGNSLGCQPKSVRDHIETELKDWETLGVEGHFHAQNPWMPYHEFLTESSAKIVGAKPNEVVVMNSLTVNLHLMMASFYRPDAQRFKIMIEADAFPSDIYAVKSQLIHHGFDPEEGLIMLKPKEGEHCVWQDDIEASIRENGDQLALILLGGVNYYTGQVFDFENITRIGHEVGAVVGFDLAHAAGNIQLKLHDWNVDFACWCTYKYINSGPGGVAGCFVHERNASQKDLPRFSGWWGHNKETRFKMGPEFDAIPTAEGWQLSNAPVLSMAALRASLDIFDEVGMEALNKKSRLLTDYLLFLLEDLDDSIEVITPKDPKQRGCQVSLLTGDNGREIFDRITEDGIICDWREPNVIRLAPVPLYNSFEDVWRFAKILKG